MIVDSALNLAKKGCFIFPVTVGRKSPPIFENWQQEATRDEEKIRKWWTKNPRYNIGISTSKFNGSNEALLVVDVDNKEDKKGSKSLLELELQGKDFPPTFTQSTPNGGKHLCYIVKEPVKQGTSVLGSGLDIRSKGGYILGAGSTLADNKIPYAIDQDMDFIPSPEWMPIACGKARERLIDPKPLAAEIDLERALKRAIHYIDREAPIAIQGEGGDQKTFVVACKLKDFGVPLDAAINLLINKWNERCEPPWDFHDLRRKVENAYQYGIEQPGSNAPEALFSKIEEEKDTINIHPFEKINEEYAFVVAGGGHRILWNTKNEKGRETIFHLDLNTFHQKLANLTMETAEGEKPKPVSQLWMRSPLRKSYDGICFMPGLQAPKRFYNLWRGFSVIEPDPGQVFPKEAHESLTMYLEHALTNICDNDKEHFNWFMGYFAHLMQSPWDKPHSAIVLKGNKGVGKNAFIEPIGHIISNHYLLTANKRYLLSNFNGHLENLLLFVLDEAFWSGEKSADGTLKDLITGRTHVIEHKGKEPYTVDNCTRICILSNEDWVVPATADERRFAVFNVGDGRKKDGIFFQKMRKGMECGGYRLLLKYLMDYKLEGINLNSPPSTKGLREQKEATLNPIEEWWLASLNNGKLLGSGLGEEWPNEVSKEHFRESLKQYIKDRQIKSWIPDDRDIGKKLLRLCPSIKSYRKMEEGERVWKYVLPLLDVARKEWEAHIGHATFTEDMN